jgi:PKD repeat protein
MKPYYKYSLLLLSCSLLNCSKEFLNNCDEQSSTYKPINASFVSSKVGAIVTFTDKSENAESYQWDFGDGTNSLEKNPVKTFTQDKTYTVKLTVKRCGERASTATEAIDMKCDASSPTVTPPSKTEICQGEAIQLNATCTNGSVVWNTGSTQNTLSVSSSGTYAVQCSKNGCLSTKSNTYTITAIPKPATPTISINNASICIGESVTLTSTACPNGTVSWSNGKTGLSITETPTTDISLTAKCLQGSCASDNSSTKPISVTQLAVAKSVAGSSTGNALTKYAITFNGEVDFKDAQKNGSVDDHGFIYLAGTADPSGSKAAISISLGTKKESGGTTFKSSLSGQTTNQFSYRAYVKSCDGKIYYGNNLKIN